MTISSIPRLFVTGATGKLGRLVIASLLKTISAAQIVAGVRNLESPASAELAALGVELRVADYAQPATLSSAFTGIDRVLLISSNELGQRVAQHQNVIAAAGLAGVGLIVYTSILHADTSPLNLAKDHVATEAALAAGGVPFVVLRNGWYTENYAASIAPALAHGVFIGSAGEGRIASAARQDYADAAAVVLAADQHQSGRIYELAGDEAYTLGEFAEEIAVQSGKAVVYTDLPEADFKAALVKAGLPDGFADLLADSDAGASKDALFDASRDLGTLIGRPTTPFPVTIAVTLKG